MAISLKKIIHPDSLRGIGSIPAGVAPEKLISAGHNAYVIAERLNGTAYKVSRISKKKAFCIFANGAYYLYVHRKYTSYRRFFSLFFGKPAKEYDIDHVMSRNISSKIGALYLLLAAVPRSANRSHGSIEKIVLSFNRKIYLEKTFPLNEQMFHKVMGEKLNTGSSYNIAKLGYVPGASHSCGLTLKMKGIWNLAFCVHISHAGLAIANRLQQFY